MVIIMEFRQWELSLHLWMQWFIVTTGLFIYKDGFSNGQKSIGQAGGKGKGFVSLGAVRDLSVTAIPACVSGGCYAEPWPAVFLRNKAFYLPRARAQLLNKECMGYSRTSEVSMDSESSAEWFQVKFIHFFTHIYWVACYVPDFPLGASICSEWWIDWHLVHKQKLSQRAWRNGWGFTRQIFLPWGKGLDFIKQLPGARWIPLRRFWSCRKYPTQRAVTYCSRAMWWCNESPAHWPTGRAPPSPLNLSKQPARLDSWGLHTGLLSGWPGASVSFQ